MSKLKEIAEQISDLYYQEIPSDEDFFQISDFYPYVASGYSKLLMDEYQTSKLLNKQEFGFSIIELSQDWLRTGLVDVVKNEKTGDYEATLPGKVMTFPYDSMFSGVQYIQPVETECKDFIKISYNDRWMLSQIPQVEKSFYYIYGDKIIFKNLKCKPSQVNVLYVPQISSDDIDFDIPTGKELEIITLVLNIMISAKQGIVIDKTNNSNPNKVIETEIDNNL